MEVKELEKNLEQACDDLGKVMAKQPPEIKEILRQLKTEAEEFSNKAMDEKKEFVDKATLFVLAITVDDTLKKNDDLVSAANDYLEADKKYTQALMEKMISQLREEEEEEK